MRRVGERLGRFRLVADIASGGMAAVYLAQRVGVAGGVDETLAVKIAHPHLVVDPVFASMFLDEARLAARIHHPNVVAVYDVDRIDGELVMAMEYVEGASLSTILALATQTGSVVPLRVALRVMHDVLVGLHAAHEITDEEGRSLGLVHRDVSPQNILVGLDGIARIADFGVAKARDRLVSTRSGEIKGKLRYLAPEQLRSEGIDRRTDVFAAGIVLWEILTGERLFAGRDDAATLMLVLDKEIRPPSTYRAEVRLAVDELCLRALERDPAARYPAARDFAAAIAAAPGGLASNEEVAELVGRLAGERVQQIRAAVRAVHAVAVDDESTTVVTPMPSRRRAVAIAVAVAVAACIGIGVTIPSRGTPSVEARASTSPPPTVERGPTPESPPATRSEASAAPASPAAAPSLMAAEPSARPAPSTPTTGRKAAHASPRGPQPAGRASAKWIPDTP